jgi:hypothetical protein
VGFNEYDRIRSKNKIHNEAYECYVNLKQTGLSDQDILGMCKNLSSLDNKKSFRPEIISEIEKIIGRKKHETKTF